VVEICLRKPPRLSLFGSCLYIRCLVASINLKSGVAIIYYYLGNPLAVKNQCHLVYIFNVGKEHLYKHVRAVLCVSCVEGLSAGGLVWVDVRVTWCCVYAMFLQHLCVVLSGGWASINSSLFLAYKFAT
jgi:hypothetical protein